MLYTNSITHPKIFSITNGNTGLDTLSTSINRSISLILLTAKGEVFGNPEFGSDIRKYLFEYITDTTKELIIDEIMNSVSMWEPRIILERNNITIEQDDMTLKIHISYTLTNSNIMGNTDVYTPINYPKEV
jgi:hypothetical protein